MGYHDNNGAADRTLIEHWNGTSWSIVTSPNVGPYDNRLYAVAVVSSNDVWAVGFHDSEGVFGSFTLTEHWNGTSWSAVTSPNVGTGDNQFSGVTAVGSNNVWAVGNYDSGSGSRTLIEHWNGSEWSIVGSSNIGTGDNYLRGVAVGGGSDDVWAVGAYNNGTEIDTLIEFWAGSGSWTIIPSPNPGTQVSSLTGVSAAGENDVWAVGYYNDGARNRTLIERYNPCSGAPEHTKP